MAIPKKKRRIITVNDTEYYWRKENNRCLYIENGQSPNFIIKGYFDKGYFAVPQVVRTVIDYTFEHKLNNQPIVLIENAHELFKTELERHNNNEYEKFKERLKEYNKGRGKEGWEHYHFAEKLLGEKNYREAMRYLMYSIHIDSSKEERWSLLENFISEDIKNAELLTIRASTYRDLSKYPELEHCKNAAFTSIEEAMQLDPDYGNAHAILAELLYDEEDLQGFYDHWEKSLQKRSTHFLDWFISRDLENQAEFIKISQKYSE